MADVKRLSKSAILNGTAQIHYEMVEELGGEVGLAPLSEGQYAQITTIKATGIKMKGNPTFDENGRPDFANLGSNFEMIMDLEQINKSDFEADALAVAYSLSGGMGETWSVEEVKGIRPPGIIARLAKIVYEISGVTPAQIEQVRNFREQSGGAKARRSTPAGASAGANAK